MASYTSFEELPCWQKCRAVRLWVEDFIKTKVPKNDFDMIDNMRRAGRSTTRNIAEACLPVRQGFGRYHFKENIRFCQFSRGSLFEIKDDLIICLDEKKVKQEDISDGLKLVSEAIHSVNGYIKYLNSKGRKS